MGSVIFKGPIFDVEKMREKIREALRGISTEGLKKIIITDSILKGISPVEGDGKYQKYSESYKKAIKPVKLLKSGKRSKKSGYGRYTKYDKQISPVNLKLSGEMLDTFFVEPSPDGLFVGFKHKLANIHSLQGAGKSKVIRHMLPVVKGSKFKRTIVSDIIDLVQKEINRILGK